MTLTLHMHPLSSFCHKVLIALYENATPFEANVVNLQDPDVRDEYRKVWPFAKFPVLQHKERSHTIPESTMIIEYLARHRPGPVNLIPDDPDRAFQVRGVDRFYDLHLHEPMQKVVSEQLRPAGGRDPIGAAQAKETIRTALRIANTELATR